MSALDQPLDNAISSLQSLVLLGQEAAPLVNVILHGTSSAVGGERGVCASRAIKSGEAVITVERRKQLSEDNCPVSISEAVDASGHDEDPFLLKMICVLYKCKLSAASKEGDASATAEERLQALYFQSLPTSFAHMPLFFSEQKLQSFGPCFPLVKLTATVQAQAQSCFSILQGIPAFGSDPAFGGAPPSLEFVKWAICCLNSRLVGMAESSKAASSDEDEDVVNGRLIPFADLLNHSFQPTLLHSVTPEGDLVFKASRAIAEGEEFTIKYHGEKDGDACSFLLHYGFWPSPESCSSESSEMRVFFRVSLNVEDVARPDSALSAAVASLGLKPSPDMALPATRSQPMPPLWIWLLRLRGMSEAQRAAFARGQVEVPAEVEREAWLTIRTELEKYGAWYRDNAALLATPGDGAEEVEKEAAGSGEARSTATEVGLRKEVHRVSLEVISSAIASLPSL
jgi:hypothetical protein